MYKNLILLYNITKICTTENRSFDHVQ